MSENRNRPIDLITIMVEQQLIALRNGDPEAFMKHFSIHAYEEYEMKKWFGSYVAKVESLKEIILNSVRIKKCSKYFYDVRIGIDLNYECYDPEMVTFLYDIIYHKEQEKILIVKSSILTIENI